MHFCKVFLCLFWLLVFVKPSNRLRLSVRRVNEKTAFRAVTYPHLDYSLRNPGDFDFGVALPVAADLADAFLGLIADSHHFVVFDGLFKDIGSHFHP